MELFHCVPKEKIAVFISDLSFFNLFATSGVKLSAHFRSHQSDFFLEPSMLRALFKVFSLCISLFQGQIFHCYRSDVVPDVLGTCVFLFSFDFAAFLNNVPLSCVCRVCLLFCHVCLLFHHDCHVCRLFYHDCHVFHVLFAQAPFVLYSICTGSDVGTFHPLILLNSAQCKDSCVEF